MKFNRAYWQQRVKEQEEFIAECGGTHDGYIARYGDPGVPRADGRPMYGDGGTAIYKADRAALAYLLEKLHDAWD